MLHICKQRSISVSNAQYPLIIIQLKELAAPLSNEAQRLSDDSYKTVNLWLKTLETK